MSTIDKPLLEKIAHLARIRLEEAELSTYQTSIQDILSFVEKINAMNVEDITPLFNPLENLLKTRPDEITTQDERENFLALAPETEAGLYLVPAVIE